MSHYLIIEPVFIINEITRTVYSRDMLLVVMEMMSGGELFNRISKKKRFTEREACSVTKQVKYFLLFYSFYFPYVVLFLAVYFTYTVNRVLYLCSMLYSQHLLFLDIFQQNTVYIQDDTL